jgi:hypothetical protein
VPVYVTYCVLGIAAEQWEAFASVPLILILYVFGQYAAFPSASSPLSNRQDDDTDGQ